MMVMFLSAMLAVLCLLPVNVAFGHTYQVHDWFWSNSGESFDYAATANSAGDTLGQYCYVKSGNCIYLVSLNIACHTGHHYAALINSNTGAEPVTLICDKKDNDEYVMTFASFKSIDTVVKSAVEVGIAVPMKDGLFRVSRFALDGSNQAINQMRQDARSRMQAAPSDTGHLPAQVDM